jgi:putative membrane protein
MTFLGRLIITALALWLTTIFYGGMSFSQPGIMPVLLAALVMGLVNAVIKPIMVVLTLPLSILTFGLFLLVINAIAISLVAALTPLNIAGFGAAIVGSIILSIVNAVLFSLFRDGESSA